MMPPPFLNGTDIRKNSLSLIFLAMIIYEFNRYIVHYIVYPWLSNVVTDY